MLAFTETMLTPPPVHAPTRSDVPEPPHVVWKYPVIVAEHEPPDALHEHVEQLRVSSTPVMTTFFFV